MSKFLVFSDMHLHNWQYGASYSNGWNSRLLAQKNVLDQIHNYCIINEIKYIFFCGDLFHTHGKVDAACLSVASDFLFKLYQSGIRSEFLVGNHDLADKAGIINSLRWIRGFDKAGLTEDWATLPEPDGLKYTTIAYTEDKEKLKYVLEQVPPNYFVFMHQGISGIPVGSDFVIPNEILTPDMIPSTIKHAFTGHYHTNRKISDKLTVVGAPMQHTWADSGEYRGWLVVDSDTGEFERVLSDSPKFVKQVVGNHIGAKGNYIRITNQIPLPLQNAMRRDLIENAGALSVEFTYGVSEDKLLTTIEDRGGFNLNDVIAKFQQSKSLDAAAIKVGEQLRQGTYETFKANST